MQGYFDISWEQRRALNTHISTIVCCAHRMIKLRAKGGVVSWKASVYYNGVTEFRQGSITLIKLNKLVDVTKYLS